MPEMPATSRTRPDRRTDISNDHDLGDATTLPIGRTIAKLADTSTPRDGVDLRGGTRHAQPCSRIIALHRVRSTSADSESSRSTNDGSAARGRRWRKREQTDRVEGRVEQRRAAFRMAGRGTAHGTSMNKYASVSCPGCAHRQRSRCNYRWSRGGFAKRAAKPGTRRAQSAGSRVRSSLRAGSTISECAFGCGHGCERLARWRAAAGALPSNGVRAGPIKHKRRRAGTVDARSRSPMLASCRSGRLLDPLDEVDAGDPCASADPARRW